MPLPFYAIFGDTYCGEWQGNCVEMDDMFMETMHFANGEIMVWVLHEAQRDLFGKGDFPTQNFGNNYSIFELNIMIYDKYMRGKYGKKRDPVCDYLKEHLPCLSTV